MKNHIFLWLSLILLVAACSDNKPFIKFPADDLAKRMSDTANFSIILYDMNIDEEGKHLHQYKVITRTQDPAPQEELVTSNDSTQTDSSVQAQVAEADPASLGMNSYITDWKEVSEEDFTFYSSDMGMEIYSKVDGKLNKVSSPPGYSQYVGNEKYGEWRTNSSGNSFWAFYGQYMFLSSMFHLMSPVPYGYYRGYGAYRGRTPYYGPNGNAYGTNSKHAKGMNSKYTKRLGTNSRLKSKVNNSISKSSSKATGGKRTASTRQSRSSSRFSGKSKSRSSGFGGK